MLLGTHSHLFRGPPAAVAEALSLHGLSCVQLSPSFPGLRFGDPAHIRPERCRLAAAPFQEAGLHVAALSNPASLLDPDLDRRHRSIIRLHALLRHCRDFASKYVVTETGRPYPLHHPDESRRELRLIVAEALRIAEEENVTLLLKPGPGHVLATVEDAFRLREELPSPQLGFVLDPASFLIDSPPEELTTRLERLATSLGPWTPVIHAKDLRYEAGGVVMPCVGRGVLDYGVLLRALRQFTLEPSIILEHLRPEEVAEAKTIMERFASA